MNGEETFGARRLMVKTHNNQGFTQLKAAVVPTVASQIKANSAAALLNKLGAAEVTCVFWCVGRCKGWAQGFWRRGWSDLRRIWGHSLPEKCVSLKMACARSTPHGHTCEGRIWREQCSNPDLFQRFNNTVGTQHQQKRMRSWEQPQKQNPERRTKAWTCSKSKCDTPTNRHGQRRRHRQSHRHRQRHEHRHSHRHRQRQTQDTYRHT